jgi:glycerophosphoryl diester phosphodiesterase
MTTATTPRPRLVAHRGAPALAPEHTIAAYEAAIAAGADVLLLDVRQTADEQLVVIHDARLERTTDGRGAVRDATVRDLKRLDAGRWFGRAFRGQRIQTLAEVLERFRERVAFAVDVPGDPDADPGIEERLITLLQIYDVVSRTLVTSLDHHALTRCRDLDPDVPIGAIVGCRLLAPAALAPRGVFSALLLPAGLTRESDVVACRQSDLDCYVGPVNDPAEARRFRAWGVAGMVSDRPELLGPVLGTP